MSDEVSSYFLRAILEAGELFGAEREELLQHLPDPEVAHRRWGALDWDDFLKLFQIALAPAGRGQDLIQAGQRYMRERHGTRTAHIYSLFLSWDQVLWVAKNYMAPRLIKGYRIDYEKLGKNHFRVRMSIPKSLRGDPDFFYYLAGIWTGSSWSANLKHAILDLQVTSHSGTAEVKLDRRPLLSRLLHNPITGYFLVRRDLVENLEEIRRQRSSLERANRDLFEVLDAAEDLVWVTGKDGIRWANRNARQWFDRHSGLQGTGLTNVFHCPPCHRLRSDVSAKDLASGGNFGAGVCLNAG